jgi:hypothetical protein
MDQQPSGLQLSDYKTANWCSSSTLMITKRTQSGGFYKIYVSSEVVMGVLANYDDIISGMNTLKSGGTGSGNIVVFASKDGTQKRVVNLSLFKGQPCYGLHVLLPTSGFSSGQFAVGKGMNFSGQEWERLIEIMKAKPLDTTSTFSAVFKLNIPVKLYSWRWRLTDKELDHLLPAVISADKFFLNVEQAFSDALSHQPQEKSHELEAFHKVVNIELNNDLIDSAVARCVLGNITIGKDTMHLQAPYSDGDPDMILNSNTLAGDLQLYGKQVYEELYLSQVYSLLVNLIHLSESSSGDLFTRAMQLLTQQGKNETQLEKLISDPSSLVHLDILKQLAV